jgi:hypothetical protein
LATYDVVSRSLVGKALRPAGGTPTLSPTGEYVLLTQRSGLLYVFDSQLQQLDSIDVSTPLGGIPGTHLGVVTRSAVFADAITAYVVAGGRDRFDDQPVRILTVDVQSRAVVDVHAMNTDDLGTLVHFSCD